MGMMSLTLRIRFWSVNRYLAERKTGQLDAEHATQKRTRPTGTQRSQPLSYCAHGSESMFHASQVHFQSLIITSLFTSQRRKLGHDPSATLLSLWNCDRNADQGRLLAPCSNPLHDVGGEQCHTLLWRGETGGGCGCRDFSTALDKSNELRLFGKLSSALVSFI